MGLIIIFNRKYVEDEEALRYSGGLDTNGCHGSLHFRVIKFRHMFLVVSLFVILAVKSEK